MNGEKFFKEMYHCIWQGNDLNRFDEFYAKSFEETISVTDERKNPIDLQMNYHDLLQQARWQKEHYKDTTFEIKKIVVTGNEYISVHFYSTSIERKTGDLKHRCVCGIWRLNREGKIDRVWAVVTPYYT